MAHSLRVRLYVALIAWPIVGVFFAVLAFNVSHWFILALFASMISIGWYSWNLRCPSCGQSVILIGGVIAAPWVPKNCRNCGRPLA